MSLTSKDIATAIDARFKSIDPYLVIDNVSIDSRSLQNNSETLFFALSGRNKDGHDYIKDLISKGVINFVVTHMPETLEGNANFLIVKNTLAALQQFAAYYRQKFSFPVIAVTGSNGKTIVKEWLNYLLSPDYTIIRSPKSYNSQIGVPLSLIGSNEKHDLGIFEAGISLPGEMEKLEQILQPNIGILTNIGNAHDEGFASREEKIKEKLKLFNNVEIVVLEKNTTIQKLLPENTKTFTWSFDTNSDVTIQKRTLANNTVLNVFYKTSFQVTIPFADSASIENAINCMMVMLYLGYENHAISNRLPTLYPVEMRLQVKDGINNCTIIDDSYNADYQSLKIALDFLEEHKTHNKKTIILSDIFQSGFTTSLLYKKVKSLLNTYGIERVIGIGETIAKELVDFPNFYPYKTTQEFLAQFNNNAFDEETILIKGARNFRFEEIVVLLEKKTHETVLEINLNAIVHNLNFYRSKLKPKTKLMVMVKAFGYGNGNYEIAKTLSHHKIDYLGVAFADEGVALRNAGITTPIIVMNPEQSAFNIMIAYKLEPEMFSLKELQAFIVLAQQKNLSNYPVHIKLDTGMHRLGFDEAHLPSLIRILQNNNFISVHSVFSHLSASDDLGFREFTQQQIASFEKWSDTLINALQINPLRHILNTSGIYNYSEAQYDMVRLGIGLYGVANDVDEMKQLETVGTLKTIILQIKDIKPGESVGYSRRFIAKRSMRIATLPIGYADGIPRGWGNGKGYVMINSKKAYITGSICMDMLMVDITEIHCNEGDNVIIFGKEPTVVTIAKELDTIAYEVMAGISQRVKRIFYKE